jgi:hypothetical protein
MTSSDWGYHSPGGGKLGSKILKQNTDLLLSTSFKVLNKIKFNQELPFLLSYSFLLGPTAVVTRPGVLKT